MTVNHGIQNEICIETVLLALKTKIIDNRSIQLCCVIIVLLPPTKLEVKLRLLMQIQMPSFPSLRQWPGLKSFFSIKENILLYFTIVESVFGAFLVLLSCQCTLLSSLSSSGSRV